MQFILIVVYISVYIGLVATTFYILGFRSEKTKGKPLFKDEDLPKVSVIIPAWNEEKSIERTVESAFSSNYPEEKFEVIVVDNNSKDKTMQIAKKLKQKYKKLKLYREIKQGKGCALNLGIKKSSGDIIFSMDADTFIEPHCIKEMTRYFKNPKVMSVTPSMLIHKPKGILQRVQQAEYLFGLFIRKAFASTNAIYVTPGAFSAYRKTFFDKHGNYDDKNITEDLEMSLRIQYKGYSIEYSPESPVYTIAPNKLKPLTIQRRRWYVGLMRNTWKYKGLISPKYGDLGILVMPLTWISIFFSVFVLHYLVIDSLLSIKDEIIFLSKVNFDFLSIYGFNKYFLESFLFNLFTSPVTFFFLFFLVILTLYMGYALKKTGKVQRLAGTVALYFIFFALMFGFWWTVSIIYVALNRTVTWR